jgi:hypothetical protein
MPVPDALFARMCGIRRPPGKGIALAQAIDEMTNRRAARAMIEDGPPITKTPSQAFRAVKPKEGRETRKRGVKPTGPVDGWDGKLGLRAELRAKRGRLESLRARRSG